MTHNVETLIIGAGPTGLGAAHRLKERGQTNFLILETAPHAGGLASSFEDAKGFTWDIGGHVQFSHYPYFDTVMDNVFGGGGWHSYPRSAWAWLLGRFVPYPVQSNLAYLPPDVANDCLAAMRNRNAAKPKNFAEWLESMFGSALVNLFMRPYNEKVWAHPPESMSTQWVGERVAVPTVEEAEKNLHQGIAPPAWGPNSQFRFPESGGTGNIWRSLAATIGENHFRYNTSVTAINPKTQTLTANGETYHYKNLLTTMPLDTLCEMLQSHLTPAQTAAAHSLPHCATHIVGLGLHGNCPPTLRDKSWVYFPEPNCPFYRATVFSNYSQTHTPDPTRFWSLMTETSESATKQVNIATLAEETIQGCINTGLIPSEDMVYSIWQYRTPHGYPVPGLARDEALKTIIPALEAWNIFSRGRFGGWKYEISNQDHSFMQGVELINRLLDATPETIYTT